MDDSFLTWLYTVQLSFIHFLHQWRSESVDTFFRSMAFFDTVFFAFLVVAAVWYGISWRWGLSLALLLVTSDTTNFLLKELFHQPRPATLDPSVGLMPFSHYSFPSGGAQQAALLFGALASWAKKRSVWIACLLMILYISFTRVFLGAHFPTDVMGSWIVAAILITLFNRLCDPVSRWFNSLSTVSQWLVAILFSLFPYLAIPISIYVQVSFFTFALLAGFLFAKKRDLLWEPKSAKQRLFGTVFAVAGVIFLQLVPFGFAKMIKKMAIALWISCGASAFFRFKR